MKIPKFAILPTLGLLQAVVAQQIGSRPVWIDAKTCDPWAKSHGFPTAGGPGGLFPTAFDILDKMANAQLYRLENPEKPSQTPLDDKVMAWERYRLNSTYDTFFGNNTSTRLGPGVFGVWDVTFLPWESIQEYRPQNAKPFVFIVCDDSSYVSKKSDGKFYYTDPHLHAEAPLASDKFHRNIFQPCAMNGETSYDIRNYNIHTQNFVLCTKQMNLPLGFTTKGPTTFESGQTLDGAVKSWLGSLFSRVQESTGLVSYYNPTPANGFNAAHAMRNDHLVVFNPDSHKYFAFALTFDDLFWGSGVGRTSHEEYARLKQSNAGKGIISAFGLTDIKVAARGITWTSGWVPPKMQIGEYPPMKAIPTA